MPRTEPELPGFFYAGRQRYWKGMHVDVRALPRWRDRWVIDGIRHSGLGMIQFDSDLRNMARCTAVSPTSAAIVVALRSANHLSHQQRPASTKSSTPVVGGFR